MLPRLQFQTLYLTRKIGGLDFRRTRRPNFLCQVRSPAIPRAIMARLEQGARVDSLCARGKAAGGQHVAL